MFHEFSKNETGTFQNVFCTMPKILLTLLCFWLQGVGEAFAGDHSNPGDTVRFSAHPGRSAASFEPEITARSKGEAGAAAREELLSELSGELGPCTDYFGFGGSLVQSNDIFRLNQREKRLRMFRTVYFFSHSMVSSCNVKSSWTRTAKHICIALDTLRMDRQSSVSVWSGTRASRTVWESFRPSCRMGKSYFHSVWIQNIRLKKLMKWLFVTQVKYSHEFFQAFLKCWKMLIKAFKTGNSKISVITILMTN